MILIFWIFIFLISLTLLVKSADWFVESAEKIGLALRISPFIIGILIIALGTSLPELASSIAAIAKHQTEILAANVVGSNIANILLIIGISAVIARALKVERNLIDLDAPLLAATTALFSFVLFDRKVTFIEGILLLLAFFVYFMYVGFQKREESKKAEFVEVLPSRADRREAKVLKRPKVDFSTILFLLIGLSGLIIGADYVVKSMIKIEELTNIPTAFVSITALAIGTSLPELMVSIQSARRKKYDLVLGNIFGSNIFNGLLILGLGSVITPLSVDYLTFSIGIPFLITATLLFIFSCISRKIYLWEGAIYIILYILFLTKLIQAV